MNPNPLRPGCEQCLNLKLYRTSKWRPTSNRASNLYSSLGDKIAVFAKLRPTSDSNITPLTTEEHNDLSSVFLNIISSHHEQRSSSRSTLSVSKHYEFSAIVFDQVHHVCDEYINIITKRGVVLDVSAEDAGNGLLNFGDCYRAILIYFKIDHPDLTKEYREKAEYAYTMAYKLVTDSSNNITLELYLAVSLAFAKFTRLVDDDRAKAIGILNATNSKLTTDISSSPRIQQLWGEIQKEFDLCNRHH